MNKSKYDKSLKEIGQVFLKYFFRGLLIVVPVATTAYVIYWIFSKLDTLLPIGIPGLGILISLAGIVVIGYLGSGLLTKPILDLFDDFLERTPGVKLIYTAIKDFLEAFVGEKKKFTEPVLVEITATGILRLGFVTQRDLNYLGMPGHVAVYVPHSYNFSGNLLIVPTDKIKPVDSKKAGELMKFVVTGGVIDID